MQVRRMQVRRMQVPWGHRRQGRFPGHGSTANEIP